MRIQKEYKEITKKTINKYLMRHKSKWETKPIVLFSVSEASQYCFEVIKRNKGKIVAIFDNDPLRRNTTWNSLPIIIPEEAKEYLMMNPVVIIAGGFNEEKKQQLLECNVPLRHILDIKIKLNLLSISLELILGNRLIRTFYKKNITHIYFCPYPGTGDAYLTGMYLYSQMEKDKAHDGNYIILTTSKAFKVVLEDFYDYKNIEIISRIQSQNIKRYVSVLGEEDPRVKYMLYWGLPQQTTFRIENRRGISFRELFKNTVFGTESIMPKLPLFDNNNQELASVFSELEIVEGKTVILAPYANSFEEELEIDWWEELAYTLKMQGFKVFTNSSGEKEPVIYGTRRIFLGYKEMYKAVEYAGFIIGMRSGLFDLLGMTKSKKIVIYQDYITKERMQFFSLKNMELCDDAVELKLDNSDEGKNVLMKQIVDIMAKEAGADY